MSGVVATESGVAVNDVDNGDAGSGALSVAPPSAAESVSVGGGENVGDGAGAGVDAGVGVGVDVAFSSASNTSQRCHC